MAVLVRSCCCGCSLKTGVLVIAFLSLISGGYNIHSGFSSVSDLSRARDERMPSPSAKRLQVSINLLNTNGAFGIIEVCTSFALFAACGLKNRFFVLPHVVLHVILLGYTLGVVLYFIFTGNLTDVVVPLLITWLLPNYLLIVVYSFYESLREDPSGVNAGYFPANPMEAVPKANCTTMEALKQPVVKADRIPGL
ncbi:uncharacterized protein [Acropora muricata]|uniref:uncharacterized protein isoform X1 n=2 Tax=Acropora muricata TaxID=159855 RepID=UPI0034E40F75